MNYKFFPMELQGVLQMKAQWNQRWFLLVCAKCGARNVTQRKF
jgi:hypothetical protein